MIVEGVIQIKSGKMMNVNVRIKIKNKPDILSGKIQSKTKTFVATKRQK